MTYTNSYLTKNIPIMYNTNYSLGEERGLCMIGKIRTDQKCPICGGNFNIDTGRTLTCNRDCKTIPSSYYIDLHWQGERIKIRRDLKKYRLDSYRRALRLLEKIRSEIDDNDFDIIKYSNTKEKDYLFENFISKWLKLIKSDLVHTTYERKVSMINTHIIPHFQDQDIREIKAVGLAEFANKIKDSDYTNSYKWSIIKELRSIFNAAYEWEAIPRIPKLPSISLEETPPEFITREQQLQVLKQIPERKRAIFQFLFLTGCRIGEARALMWDRVDFKNRVIIIGRTFSGNTLRETTKTKIWRLLPMWDTIYELLLTQKKQKANSFFVFTNPDNNNNPYSTKINKLWRIACRKAGIKITLYRGTRHSYFTQKAREGHSIESLKAIAGHTHTKTTEKYVKMYVDSLLPIMSDNIKELPTVQKPSKNKK